MAGVAVSAQVQYRDNFGRFIQECKAAGARTMNDLADEMETDAQNFAPKKTGRLSSSIKGVSTGTRAVVFSDLNYAMAQEKGARPHRIIGSPDLAFYWKRKGRNFVPSSWYYSMPGMITTVSHPGNPATNYLKRAYQLAMRKAIVTASRNYPG